MGCGGGGWRGRLVQRLLPGSFSPGAAEAGLLGAKEGASWLQSLGLTHWDWSEAEATGKGLSQRFQGRNSLTSSLLQRKCYVTCLRVGAHRNLSGATPTGRRLEGRWSAGMQESPMP